ncbi:auxin-responsive protein IAA19-like isoform X2 [Triticum dicoccoides]|uniref:auxin-responsive protein IAA19-like isoform X2 n=1 Tax=Triticum dicoccoides TaxID=85692 RepID=UPI00188DFC5E|nr:auxin-responsive protein IAA19-like isoform X2 [Triticum dicoccoides]
MTTSSKSTYPSFHPGHLRRRAPSAVPDHHSPPPSIPPQCLPDYCRQLTFASSSETICTRTGREEDPMGGGGRSRCPHRGSAARMREKDAVAWPPDPAKHVRKRRPTGRGAQLQIRAARAEREARKRAYALGGRLRCSRRQWHGCSLAARFGCPGVTPASDTEVSDQEPEDAGSLASCQRTKTKAENEGRSETEYPGKVDLKTYLSHENISLEFERMFSCFITCSHTLPISSLAHSVSSGRGRLAEPHQPHLLCNQDGRRLKKICLLKQGIEDSKDH